MILCFSATGNSQYAAEKIAAATGDRVISIGSALRSGASAYDITDDDRLGFVVPTFAWTLPGAVALFIERMRLTGYRDQYTYGVFTCGESAGNESAALKTMLASRGIRFFGSFDLVMPDNFIVWSDVPAPARLESILNKADKKLDAIIDAIRSNKCGTIAGGTPKDLYMPIQAISTAKGTSKLFADEKCVACGLCGDICPMGCIKKGDKGRPVWEGDCTLCLACLHRCPARAVQHGNDTQNKGRYVNPRVNLVDRSHSS